MGHWIEHPSEPKDLLLVWQAPLTVPDRVRWAVGRLTKVGAEAVFDYLRSEEFAALNLGRSDEALRAAGYSGYPTFVMRKRREGDFRDRVLEAFLRRVPSATRSDFPGYLAHHLIKPSTSETDFTMDLKAIDVPILVMHGDDDQIVPIADSALLSVKLLRKGELKVYKGLPHGMATTHADIINKDLLAFFKA